MGSLYFHAPCRLSKLFPAKRYRVAFAHQICMYQRDNPLVPKFMRDIEMIYYVYSIAEFSKKSITRVVTLLIVPTSITKANYVTIYNSDNYIIHIKPPNLIPSYGAGMLIFPPLRRLRPYYMRMYRKLALRSIE
jgi:hypothetical protein